jgi:hypothetical protein
MARPRKNLPSDVTDTLNKQERASKGKKPTAGVPLPGGKRMALGDFIGHEFRPERRTSVFTDAIKYLKHQDPDCMYVWKNAAKGHNHELMQGIRMGYYRPITVDDMVDEIDVPIGSLTLPSRDNSAGECQAVVLRDLVLVEVRADKASSQYKSREYEAAARTVPSSVRAQFEGQLGNLADGLVGFEAEENDVDLTKF